MSQIIEILRSLDRKERMTAVWLRTARRQGARSMDPTPVHHVADRQEDRLAAVAG